MQLEEYLKTKSDEYFSLYTNIKQAAENIWKEDRLGWYTDHGAGHSSRIVDLLDQMCGDLLLSDHQSSGLRPDEVFLLLSAAWLHDIGMQDLTDLNNRSVSQQTETEWELVRKRHPARAQEIIAASAPGSDQPNPFSIGLESNNKPLHIPLSLICKGHGSTYYEEVAAKLNNRKFNIEGRGEPVRGALLTSLLLLADELDLHGSRAVWKKNYPLSKVSELHYFRHHFVNHVEVVKLNDVDKQVQITLALPEDTLNGKKWAEDLQNWLERKLKFELKRTEGHIQTGFNGYLKWGTKQKPDVVFFKERAEPYEKKLPPKEVITLLHRETTNHLLKAQKTDSTERMEIGIAMTAFETLDFAFREHSENDYGINAQAELIFSEQPTGQLLAIQLKSEASYLAERCDTGFVFRTDKDHVEYWLNYALPVLVCLCDVETRNVYWQVVNQETACSTGKRYKIIVPSAQQINSSSKKALQNLLTPIVPASRYTIFRQNETQAVATNHSYTLFDTDDVSHAGAKRYSFKVVINDAATKAEIAAIVRQVTNEGAKRRYHRNHLVEGLWGDCDAHIVWTFIYPTAEDYNHNTWVCRSIWIHESLEEQFRPVGFDGENVGDNIIVDWNDDYREWSQVLSACTGSKEEYLSAIFPIIDELKRLFQEIAVNLLKYKDNEINEKKFIELTGEALQRIYELYSKSIDLPFAAPFECRDVDQKFQNFASNLDNIRLHYAEDSRHNWTKKNRLYLSIKQYSLAQENLQNFEYELSKIR
ncbi:DUF4365 domain-containing protein [Desulfobulbus sp. TB]|nr:DUF4365 domain-containing protein [Desulfobulbus sp. TB]